MSLGKKLIHFVNKFNGGSLTSYTLPSHTQGTAAQFTNIVNKIIGHFPSKSFSAFTCLGVEGHDAYSLLSNCLERNVFINTEKAHVFHNGDLDEGIWVFTVLFYYSANFSIDSKFC